jgi:hypothetical protein
MNRTVRPERKLVRPATDVSQKVGAAGAAGLVTTVAEAILSGTFDWKMALVAGLMLVAAYLRADRV